jgi:hypothetical protein
MRMPGSTIIAEKNPSRLAEIASVADLDRFTCLELDTMTTLDFQAAAARAGVKWAEGKPIRYSPEQGMALFKVHEQGLSCLLDAAAGFDAAQQADLDKLAEFVGYMENQPFTSLPRFDGPTAVTAPGEKRA